MKPKPKPLQYLNRVRRIPRRIITLQRELKNFETTQVPETLRILEPVSIGLGIIEKYEKQLERKKQTIRNQIAILCDRHAELERLGFASVSPRSHYS